MDNLCPLSWERCEPSPKVTLRGTNFFFLTIIPLFLQKHLWIFFLLWHLQCRGNCQGYWKMKFLCRNSTFANRRATMRREVINCLSWAHSAKLHVKECVINVWKKAYIQLTPEYARGQQSAVEFIHLYFQILVFEAYISIWNSKGTSFIP